LRRVNRFGKRGIRGNFGRNSPNPGQNVAFSAFISKPARTLLL
jgi:hypothetical protein